MLSIKIYSAAEWGAVPPRSTPTVTEPSGFIVIHHTGSKPSSGGTLDGGKKLARAIQKDHMSRVTPSGVQWIDSGHNFLNTISGIVFEGRHRTIEATNKGKCVISAHSNHSKANKSPGIENEGIYMTESMPPEQWDSLVNLCADLCKSLKLSPDNIKGHRDFSATDCPGDWLYAQLPQLIADVKKRMK